MKRLTLAIAGLLGAAVLTPATAHATDSIPFSDPMAKGGITLCDQQGKPITSGSVLVAPFAWSVHSDVAAVTSSGKGPQYLGAQLQAYQPRDGVDPGDWSGALIVPEGSFDDPAHPAVQLTPADDGLFQFINSYPPEWDHLIELRLLVNTGNGTRIDKPFAAVVLRISDDGTKWTAVDPGTVPCSAGVGRSQEASLGVPGATSTTASPIPSVKQQRAAAAGASKAAVAASTVSGGSPRGASASSGANGSAPGSGGAVGGSAALTTSAAAAASAGSSSSDSGHGLAVGLVLGVVVALFGAGFAMSRRRPVPSR